ncbi:dnaJ homolog subfamily C member 17 [Lucilia sericata]|uniref:dnaJ homolog subfamily C member 17 n=1 Tax=Lucilia sericata TaxID=13632 RepID=UPI0018A81F05|nr:dnaJ homolog subfamily C member 17 [Lucilia sericata]
MTSKKYSEVNFYAILGIEIEADESTIRKAYRKKALECHPDKNPDNPKAAELFHELSKALEILTDKAARTAYDNVWKAKKAAELRNKQLDSKRQKLKADLEKREREFQNNLQSGKTFQTTHKSDEDILQEQIERLRREGSRLLEEEQAMLREQLQKSLAEHMQLQNKNDSTYRLKIKWKAEKKDPLNGGYTKENIITYLKKYGDIVALVMSKKCGSALVEFKTLESAEMALAYEKGLVENPLNIEWITHPPSDIENQRKTAVTTTDYEDLVMRKLRQAEERKRIIEQLQKEDL